MKNCVIYDFTFYRGKMTGIARYGIELLRSVSSLGIGSVVAIVPTRYLGYFRRTLPDNVLLDSIHTTGNPLIDGVQLSTRIATRYPGACFHAIPSLANFVIAPRTVVTIHDLKFLKLGRLLNRRSTWRRFAIGAYYWLVVRWYKSVVCVSESTLTDLVEAFPFAGHKATAIPSGRTLDFQHYDGPKENLVFYLGELRPHKNLEAAVRAFLRFNQTRDYRFVIAGNRHPSQKPLNGQDVDFLGPISDGAARDLFKRAKIFFFPSLYEGFGFPVLEAMAYSCTVVTSNSSSLPEVGGSACIYVDPTDDASLVSGLERADLETMTSEYQSRLERNLERFSWEKTANSMREIYGIR